MENLPTYRLTQSGPEAQEILDQVNINTIDIEQLKRLYQALNQSEPEIIEPNDTWPVANPEENVIYRVIDRVNTPPQYYSDYMWNGTSMVLMGQYNNAIDNEPTANSNNLVKSGGVYSFVHANGGAYDISAANAVGGVLATYDDLADALGTNGANVPAAVRKGGMSIKFVLSSGNKYVRFNYLLSSTTDANIANVNNWQGVDDKPTAGSKNLITSGGAAKTFNTKIFTQSYAVNKVIRHLFIDTSGYTGSLSLEGLSITILARSVGGLWGLQIRNSSNEIIINPWMSAENAIQEVTTFDNIYMYVEYNWENMDTNTRLSAALTNEPLLSINDPRGKIKTNRIANGAVTTDKIANGAVTTDKIANGAVTTDKIANGAVTTDKIANGAVNSSKVDSSLLPINFNMGSLVSILDRDQFSTNSDIFSNVNGDSTTPKVFISDQYDNPLGLKYTRCFSPVDAQYQGAYYPSPYRIFRLTPLQGKKEYTLGYMVNGTLLARQTIYAGYAPNNYQPCFDTNLTQNGSYSKDATNFTASASVRTVTYKEQIWAFVEFHFAWKNDVDYSNYTPIFILNVIGGASNIGKVYVTCNWSLFEGNKSLEPLSIYFGNRDFYSMFANPNNITEDMLDSELQAKIDSSNPSTLEDGIYCGAGDSITEGAGLHASEDVIQTSDPFYPLSGTAKKTYMYYIAKRNNMKWRNYGSSGSTLGNVTAGGISRNGFSVTRYQNIDPNATHISIWFGWNDAAYGYVNKIEDWLYSEYGEVRYWTTDSSKFDTIASGNVRYLTQAMYNSVLAKTGTVGGTSYTGVDYFKAVYYGISSDSTNDTWWGAWNVVLKYLVEHFPSAKILVITGYGGNATMWDIAISAAKKYGVGYLDLSQPDAMNFINRRNGSESNGTVYYNATLYTNRDYWASYPSENVAVTTFRMRYLLYDACHPNKYGYQYLYPRINLELFGL